MRALHRASLVALVCLVAIAALVWSFRAGAEEDEPRACPSTADLIERLAEEPRFHGIEHLSAEQFHAIAEAIGVNVVAPEGAEAFYRTDGGVLIVVRFGSRCAALPLGANGERGPPGERILALVLGEKS